MNNKGNERRKILKYAGATALLASAGPKLIYNTAFANAAPMSMAAFSDQLWGNFQFYDDAALSQANLLLSAVTDLTVESGVEQFVLNFTSYTVGNTSALPDGIYNVTCPSGETISLYIEFVSERNFWFSIARDYRAVCALLA